MLEVLLAVKNNNVNKIPNYDPSHFEHLRKSLKTYVREGNFVTEMKIGLKVFMFNVSLYYEQNWLDWYFLWDYGVLKLLN